MEHKKLKFSTVLVLGLGLTALHAQEAIPASGGNASGSGGSASYSVGQVVYSSNSGTNGLELQGVQQAYEIWVVTGINDARWISLSCSVYPNPVTDYLNLKVDNADRNGLSYQFFDMTGRLIDKKKIDSKQTSIPVGGLVPATYLLKVLTGNAEIRTFKIIKH